MYIVECSDGSFYTGVAYDVDKRISKHNSGKGAKYTRSRRPVVLRYSCELGSYSEALREEIRIKRLTREQKELLIYEARDRSV